jgi:hypothetical protein
VVDARDSLLNAVVKRTKETFQEKVKEGQRMMANVAGLCDHILKMGEDGEIYLTGLSPMGIVKAPDKVFVVVHHPLLFENGDETGKFSVEIGRWKAPEILNGDEEKETEKSCVYTIGSVVHTMLTQKRPFEEEEDDELVKRKILEGDRANVSELEEKKCPLLDLIVGCWFPDPADRPNLVGLKKDADEVDWEHLGEEGDEEEEITVSELEEEEAEEPDDKM